MEIDKAWLVGELKRQGYDTKDLARRNPTFAEMFYSRVGSRIYLIPYTDVFWVKADSKITMLVTKEREYPVEASLVKLSKHKIFTDNFFQVSNAAWVRNGCMSQFKTEGNTGVVYIAELDEWVHVSRRRIPRLRKKQSMECINGVRRMNGTIEAINTALESEFGFKYKNGTVTKEDASMTIRGVVDVIDPHKFPQTDDLSKYGYRLDTTLHFRTKLIAFVAEKINEAFAKIDAGRSQ